MTGVQHLNFVLTFTLNFDTENCLRYSQKCTVVQKIQITNFRQNVQCSHNEKMFADGFFSTFREEGEGRKKQDEATRRLQVCTEDGYRYILRIVTGMY